MPVSATMLNNLFIMLHGANSPLVFQTAVMFLALNMIKNGANTCRSMVQEWQL
jgi:hypothetical protein